MSYETAIILFLVGMATKHFIIDFPLQGEDQWRNKGTYGHFGGIKHALFHALGTMIVLAFFTNPALGILCALLDGVIHYHIDWAKMNFNAKKGWKPDTHPEFWILLGLDQFLHTLTYIAILGFLILPL
jgi:hypothetical protein